MNNQLTPVPSTILRNKLGTLAIKLQQQADPKGRNQDFNTLEKIVTESIKILSGFYKNLSKPGFEPIKIIQDTVPSAEAFNQNMTDIYDDLKVIFNEFENLEGVILGNFNYMVSRLNRLNRKLKSVSSQLGDFILFSNLITKDAIFFGDSFNNLSRVEVNSPLLNSEQCEINQVEGIATLPIDRNAQSIISITEVPVINNNSNGVPGNNFEAGAQFNGTITDILDNNPDTWFEYERILKNDDGVALTLDITVNLGEEKIINFIRINPNNFGTRTQVEIINIDTSIDGKDFVSIKDDIPIADFIAEDEENVFALAPSTSKFAGQGLYTFTPRKAKYLRLTFRQSTSYIILTTAGTQRVRYAIGLRDIEVQALPYKEQGELISTNYQIGDEVRKVVLLSNQKPDAATTSVLASIDHFVSPDNGVTWHQIRPKVSAGLANVEQEIPELLDFNGISKNAIKTTNQVSTLRYKAVMKRNADAFVNDNPELAQTIASNTELHTPPTTTPFEIKLQKKPIDGTLKIIDPQFGSRGKEDVKYRIAIGSGGKKVILLPFKNLKKELYKEGDTNSALRERDPQTIYVDGEPWTRNLSPSSTATDKHYKLNFSEGRLEFGDDTNGMVVKQGSVIEMTLSEERIFPSKGTDHIATLDYPTSNDKKQLTIDVVYPSGIDTQVLKKGANRFQLLPNILEDSIPDFSDSQVFNQVTDFIDGNTELISMGTYSIDYNNGIIYTSTPTSVTKDTTVTYFHTPRLTLNEEDWDFVDTDDGIGNSISIQDNAFITFKRPPTTRLVLSPTKYFNLSNLGVIRNTVIITDKDGNSIGKEVEYIDGRTELTNAIPAKEQLRPITGISSGIPTLVSIPFSLPIHQEVAFNVSFTNQEIFKISKSSTPIAVGEYWVRRDQGLTGTIEVMVDENVLIPGFVNYYYVDSQLDLSNTYSINYNTGEVFLHDEITDDIIYQYEYTDFRVKYNIAREISSEDWEYNSTDNKITFKDREILKNIRTPQTLGVDAVSSSKFYQASYQYVKTSRAQVNELEAFFSPTLKDYSLKVITRSRLV